MYKAEWGQKFICPECSQKFYSMGKIEGLSCPSCKADYDVQANRKLRNNQILKAPTPVKPTLDDEVIVENNAPADDIFTEEDDDTDVPIITKAPIIDDGDNEDDTPAVKSTETE